MLQSSTTNGNTFWFFWDGYTPSLLTFGSQASTSAALPSYFNHPWELGGTVCHFDLGTDFELNSVDDAVFYLYDEAGNIIALADDTGTLLHTFEQDAWGNDLGGTFTNSLGVEQHQTGKFLDSETGLYYFGARWYDPSLGRFISESPIAPFAEEEYAYCFNSPTNFVDLNGNFAQILDIGLTGYDLYDLHNIYNDPCASLGYKIGSTGLVFLGAILPGNAASFKAGFKWTKNKIYSGWRSFKNWFKRSPRKPDTPLTDFFVTRQGVAVPNIPKYEIPSNYIENPHFQGNAV